MSVQLQVSNVNFFKLDHCNWAPKPFACQVCNILAVSLLFVKLMEYTNDILNSPKEVLSDFITLNYFVTDMTMSCTCYLTLFYNFLVQLQSFLQNDCLELFKARNIPLWLNIIFFVFSLQLKAICFVNWWTIRADFIFVYFYIYQKTHR